MRAKKSLGQNFLDSESTVSDIVREADLSSSDTVLEIGPGRGVLTASLFEKAGKVIAVEKDNELIPVLEGKFSKEIAVGKLELVHADILDFKVSDHGLEAGKYKLIANIPYYITGAIFKKFLESESPEKIVMLVQKEVGERIAAKDNKGSILSISIKVFGEPKFVKTVPKEYFSPAPKVDSAIVSISNIKNPFVSSEEKEKFFDTVKRGFAHKRKLLINNVGGTPEIFSSCDVKENARAENLSVSQWLCLSKNL